MTDQKKRGRKPLSTTEQSVTWALALTESQLAKLKQLGGAKWVREMIEEKFFTKAR